MEEDLKFLENQRQSECFKKSILIFSERENKFNILKKQRHKYVIPTLLKLSSAQLASLSSNPRILRNGTAQALGFSHNHNFSTLIHLFSKLNTTKYASLTRSLAMYGT